jgi:hypothetical protein
MTSSTRAAALTEDQVQAFVADWYATLDRHEPFEAVAKFIDPTRVRFVFPEVTVDDLDGLRDWYVRVTRTFFDEVHRVDVVDVRLTDDVARVHVVVNWTTRVWDPPAAASRILSYDADQTWLVVAPYGRPLLRDYVVNGLAPVGDTPPLA